MMTQHQILREVQKLTHLELPPRLWVILKDCPSAVVEDFHTWVEAALDIAGGDATGLGSCHDDLIPWDPKAGEPEGEPPDG